jgi:bile acid-coenzyme A ligase
MAEPVPPISTQVSRLAQLAPDEPAVTCEGRTITRGELDASTNRLARAYAELGVGVGDYVTIVLPNSIEWIQAIIACWKLGAVPQPMSARLPAAEFIGILDLKPRALIVGREDPRGEVGSVAADFVPDEALSDAPLPEAVSPVWKAMTSGGSTGRPKLIEAGGDSRVTAEGGYAMGAQEGDVNLVSVPLSHSTGCNIATAGLLLGHHLVIMPRFDAAEFLRLVTEHRVTFLATVPTIMQRLLPVYRADPAAYDLSSIRRFWHLGAPCPPVIKRAWIDLLGPEVIWELYGGTELQALTFISGDQYLTHPGSVGTVVAGEMKVDDDGNECAPGVVGGRDLHAPVARQRTHVPLHRRHREEPRRLGLAGRPRLLRRGRLPVPQRPARRHVHRRRPQRVPRGDRSGTIRTRTCCPAWSLASPTRISARCRTRSCKQTDSTKPPSSRF